MSKHVTCGFVAIIGRPNVGKSTLLNHIMGQKITITANKPQTTRHNILGIKTTQSTQVIYIDTPGIHTHKKGALNAYLNKAAKSTLHDVDVILFIVDNLAWQEEDQAILSLLAKHKIPVILAINKIDKLRSKTQLLPHIEMLNQQMDFLDIIPISAKKGYNVDKLEKVIAAQLPTGPYYFPAEQITDRSERFLAAEIIREKFTRSLAQELPYKLTIEIEKFKLENKILNIAAVIYVEKPGQKAIIIGNKGETMKHIATLARKDLEVIFANKVFLQCWVKVKSGWSDDARALKHLGYGN